MMMRTNQSFSVWPTPNPSDPSLTLKTQISQTPKLPMPFKTPLISRTSKAARPQRAREHLEASREVIRPAQPLHRGWGRRPMSERKTSRHLYKQRSLSSDTNRDEAWLRRKGNYSRRRRSKSVTDDDLEELKACIELGFGFDSPDLDRKLSDTFPALEFYYAVNKQYNDSMSKGSSSSPTVSECETSSPLGSPHTIFDPGDNPQLVKTRLRHWAQVVACSVRQSS